jgi:tetratricopeptide (TPR) repeat protein
MEQPDIPSSYQANLRRGEMLRGQNRYAEAEKYLQEAIGEEPNNAEGYYELAFCYCNWSGHSPKALATIDRAIALDPNRAEFFALRSWILGNLDKQKDAVQVAERALEMNPFSVLALNSLTRAHGQMAHWKQAEESARRTLEINPRNELAANFLAQALRQQGRMAESDAVTRQLLAQVPDNAMAQCNAGWSALQMGDYRRANQFFMESLRLDPDYDYARRGLLHSFNSRVWIYRLYFQMIAWLGKHTKGMRWFFVIVIYLVYQGLLAGLRTEYGTDDAQPWILVAMVFYLILFGFGRSFGNFFLLFDRFARHALTAQEKRFAGLVAFMYGAALGCEIFIQAWPQTAILVGIVVFFLWGVLYPRIQDAFARFGPEPMAE